MVSGVCILVSLVMCKHAFKSRCLWTFEDKCLCAKFQPWFPNWDFGRESCRAIAESDISLCEGQDCALGWRDPAAFSVSLSGEVFQKGRRGSSEQLLPSSSRSSVEPHGLGSNTECWAVLQVCHLPWWGSSVGSWCASPTASKLIERRVKMWLLPTYVNWKSLRLPWSVWQRQGAVVRELSHAAGLSVSFHISDGNWWFFLGKIAWKKKSNSRNFPETSCSKPVGSFFLDIYYNRLLNPEDRSFVS